MTFVHRPEPEPLPAHVCPKPSLTDDILAGTIWRCDECGQHWRASYPRYVNNNRVRRFWDRVERSRSGRAFRTPEWASLRRWLIGIAVVIALGLSVGVIQVLIQ